jgi:Na+-translocating ferredoxin:NAD+ oxidoreductase RnfG subunit
MKSAIPEIILNLILVALLLAAAAAPKGKLLGEQNENLFSQKTDEKTLKAEPPSEKLLRENGFDSCELRQVKNGFWTIHRPDGSLAGRAIATLPFSRNVYGYCGRIPMLIFLDANNAIRDIVVLENDETPEFLRNVQSKGLPGSWVGKSAADALSSQVDAVTGATATSDAIVASVKNALAEVDSASAKSVATDFGHPLTVKTLIAFAVLILAIVMSFFKVRNPKLRTFQLVLNIVVLGFGCGKFISLSLLLGWLGNGLNPVTAVVLICILLAAIVMPMLNRRGFYCTWLCPFGSAQELAGRLTKRKLQFPPGWLTIMNHMREGLFMLFLFLAWLGLGTSVINDEPFSAFLFQQASPVVLILAGSILVLSVFIHRPWCRYFCPTGQVLGWIQKMD